MRGWVLTAPGKLVLKELELPQPKDNEVLIKVRACGVCKTDFKIYSSIGVYQHWNGYGKYPTVFGHEITGVVAKLGKDVKEFREGDRVLSRIVYGGYAEYCVAKEHTTL